MILELERIILLFFPTVVLPSVVPGLKVLQKPSMVTHTCDPSIEEAEAGEL